MLFQSDLTVIWINMLMMPPMETAEEPSPDWWWITVPTSFSANVLILLRSAVVKQLAENSPTRANPHLLLALSFSSAGDVAEPVPPALLLLLLLCVTWVFLPSGHQRASVNIDESSVSQEMISLPSLTPPESQSPLASLMLVLFL